MRRPGAAHEKQRLPDVDRLRLPMLRGICAAREQAERVEGGTAMSAFIQDGLRLCGWCADFDREPKEMPVEIAVDPGAECEDCDAVMGPDGEWERRCIDCGGPSVDEIAAGPICNECADRRDCEAQDLEGVRARPGA
jgi:hypothetical protein